jgi:hypothetical protein
MIDSLQIFVVYHPADTGAKASITALERAFGSENDAGAPVAVGATDPFGSVLVNACCDPLRFAAECPPDSDRVLFVLLLRAEMALGDWGDVLRRDGKKSLNMPKTTCNSLI